MFKCCNKGYSPLKVDPLNNFRYHINAKRLEENNFSFYSFLKRKVIPKEYLMAQTSMFSV